MDILTQSLAQNPEVVSKIRELQGVPLFVQTLGSLQQFSKTVVPEPSRPGEKATSLAPPSLHSLIPPVHREYLSRLTPGSETCIPIGPVASQDQTISWCVYIPTTTQPVPDPPPCLLRFCLSIPALRQHVAQFPPGKECPMYQRDELVRVVRQHGLQDRIQIPVWMSSELRDVVDNFESFTSMQQQGQNDPLVTVLARRLMAWLGQDDTSIRLDAGTIFSYTQKAYQFLKKGLKKGLQWAFSIGKWLLDHPFWASLLVMLAKTLRIVLCAYFGGLSWSHLETVIREAFFAQLQHPVIDFVLRLGKVLYECVGLDWKECLRSLKNTLSGSFRLAVKFMEWFWSSTLSQVPLIGTAGNMSLSVFGWLADFADDPWKATLGLVRKVQGEKAELQVTEVLGNVFFANTNVVLITLVVNFLPVRWWTAILDIYPWGRLLTSKLEEYGLSLPQIIYFCINSSVTLLLGAMNILEELQQWITDVLPCIWERLTNALNPFSKIPNPMGACCADSAIRDLRAALGLPQLEFFVPPEKPEASMPAIPLRPPPAPAAGTTRERRRSKRSHYGKRGPRK